MSPTRFTRTTIGILLAAAAFSVATDAQVRDTRQAGQTPAQPQNTGVIAGTVISADMGRPVRRARVSITGGAPSVARSIVTDEQGAFEFTNLPAGEFTLAASKGGYIQSSFGQKQPGSGRPGTPIPLAAAQRVTNVTLPLSRGSVFSGGVFDEAGEPFYGVSVRAYRWVMQSGERTLQQAGQAATDERGLWRIPLMLPGDYVVSASVPGSADFVDGMKYITFLDEVTRLNGEIMVRAKIDGPDAPPTAPTTAFPTMFYPGVIQASAASTVTLAPGEERGGVDFHLQVMPTSRIQGTVIGPEGPVTATVQLIDLAQVPGLGIRAAKSSADGRFSFPGVTPGQYSLIARAVPKGSKPLEASGREAAEFLAAQLEEARRVQVAAAMSNVNSLWATADIAVDGRGEVETQLTLQPGLAISGRIAFDGLTGAPPPLTRMSVSLVPIGVPKTVAEIQLATPAPVDATGRFTLRGIMPGRYSIAISGGAPAGFTLQSAVFGVADILDAPLVITGNETIPPGTLTLSNKSTTISGVVRDQTGKPTAGVTVIAFAADERFWTPRSRRVTAARPSLDGRYSIRNLPPGTYRLVAIEDVETGRWFDPEFLRNLRDVAFVTLTEGATSAMDLSCKLSER
jgi:uncharacterized protein (DUF2141 family)